ncbi:MAG: chlorophyll a/b-binding protein [Cyanobium sp.]
MTTLCGDLLSSPLPHLALSPPLPSDPSADPSSMSATTRDIPSFGWSAYAERVNGRFAMLGFAAVLLIELLSQDTFLHWAGLVP